MMIERNAINGLKKRFGLFWWQRLEHFMLITLSDCEIAPRGPIFNCKRSIIAIPLRAIEPRRMSKIECQKRNKDMAWSRPAKNAKLSVGAREQLGQNQPLPTMKSRSKTTSLLKFLTLCEQKKKAATSQSQHNTNRL